jgi:hypothetical protein
LDSACGHSSALNMEARSSHPFGLPDAPLKHNRRHISKSGGQLRG